MNSSNEKLNLFLQFIKQYFTFIFPLLIAYLQGLLGINIVYFYLQLLIWFYFVGSDERHNLRARIREDIREYNQDYYTLEFTETNEKLSHQSIRNSQESVNWVNKMAVTLWPKVKGRLEWEVKNLIQNCLPSFVVMIGPFDFGSNPPQFTSIENTSTDQSNRIKLELDLVFESDCNIRFQWGWEYLLLKFKSINNIGIKDFRIKGKLQIELDQLAEDVPFVNCVTFNFVEMPVFDFKPHWLVKRVMVREVIAHLLKTCLVSPQKLTWTFGDDTNRVIRRRSNLKANNKIGRRHSTLRRKGTYFNHVIKKIDYLNSPIPE